MAQSKKAVADSTANKDKQKLKGINIPSNIETCIKTQSMTSDNVNIEAETQSNTNIDRRHLNTGRPGTEVNEELLDKLSAYAAQDIANVQIAKLMDLSTTTFYKLMRESPEFKNAYNKGIDDRKYELEKALFRRATGFDAQEIKTEKDAEGKVTRTTIVDKSYVPDTAAAIFALKNVYSDKYKEKIETTTNVNINIQQIGNMSNEELLQHTGSILPDDIDFNDYEIE